MMNKMKALFFDIDGTLLSEKTRQIPESAKEALKEARRRGHLVFINTGRVYCHLSQMKAMCLTRFILDPMKTAVPKNFLDE